MNDFDWEEFLVLAEELVRRHGDAGAERSAISRAYYAVFHLASAHFLRCGGRLTRTGVDHRLVWDWFLRPGATGASRRIGTAGFRLKQARRRADYESGRPPVTAWTARRLIDLARQLQTDLSRLP